MASSSPGYIDFALDANVERWIGSKRDLYPDKDGGHVFAEALKITHEDGVTYQVYVHDTQGWRHSDVVHGESLDSFIVPPGLKDIEWKVYEPQPCENHPDVAAIPRGRHVSNECQGCSYQTVVSCVHCGKPDNAKYMGNIRQRMLASQTCFICNFWLELSEKHADKDNYFMNSDNFNHYQIRRPGVQKNKPSHVLGFAGSKFNIRFEDGREVVTNDLWHQGHVPERFRKLFPRRAKFI